MGVTKPAFAFLHDLIASELESVYQHRAGNLVPSQKLALFLTYLRGGCFQRVVGGQHHVRVCQGWTSVLIRKVAGILASHLPELVHFPSTEECKYLADDFYQQCGIPGIVGVIDGCHFEIVRPQSKCCTTA